VDSRERREYRRAIGHLYYYSIPFAYAECLERIAQTIGVAICLRIGVPYPFEVDTFIFTEPLDIVFDETTNVHGSTFYSRAFSAGNEAVCDLIVLEIDSTLVASGRQAHILNDVFFPLTSLFMGWL
jgi:hypothetical protein